RPRLAWMPARRRGWWWSAGPARAAKRRSTRREAAADGSGAVVPAGDQAVREGRGLAGADPDDPPGQRGGARRPQRRGQVDRSALPGGPATPHHRIGAPARPGSLAAVGGDQAEAWLRARTPLAL